MSDYDITDGSKCPRKDCAGTVVLSEVDDCQCHINPPCEACVESGFCCDTCDWESSNEDE